MSGSAFSSSLHQQGLAILADSRFTEPSGLGAKAQEGISWLILGLVLIVAAPLAIYMGLRIARFVREKRERELIEEMKHNAGRHEKAGEYVSAGLIYEKLKDPEKAAGLFERGGDFARAAELYESLGEIEKAKEMHQRAGDSGKAAEVCMSTGDFIGAARIYSQMGEKMKAAQALEFSGNRLAAVRAYREANDYLKASRLLKEEGMYREAAGMYAIALVGEEIDPSNIERFYAYASLLEKAEETTKAYEIYRGISAIDPGYMDVAEKTGSLAPGPIQKEDEKTGDLVVATAYETPEATPRGTTLQSLLSPRMEPRYSFRLWFQILKALDKRQKQPSAPENLSPEGISIDAGNNVLFSEGMPKNPVYLSPEAAAGSPRDQASLIYSMGVLLYEMLAGGLDSFGTKKPGEVQGDVPEWLDELAMKCTERERASRYRSFDEIFAALRALKNRG